MASPRTLRVYPNPYLHVDSQGRASAALPMEPVDRNDTGKRFVGATIQHRRTYTKPRTEVAQQDMQETWFEFDDEPVTVPDTTYYRLAIRHGELIPADEATSKTCSLKHVEPHHVLEKHKLHAQKKLLDLAHEEHGDEVHHELADHAFGPMKGTKERRDRLAQAKKDAEAAAKNDADAVEKEATDAETKAAEELKAGIEKRLPKKVEPPKAPDQPKPNDPPAGSPSLAPKGLK